jgi:membrane protease YdiL (CAAX protease family)
MSRSSHHVVPSPYTYAESGWKGWWDRGGFWKAVVLVVAYLALYLAAGRAIGAIWGDQIDADNPLSTAESVWFGVSAAIAAGIVVLLVFGLSIRWLKELFGPQPIRGSWWMWILPAIVLVTNLSCYATADYDNFATDTVIAILVSGLFVGFAEELIARGFVVNLLRRHGYKEFAVAVLSSLLFALMHAVNLLSGQALTVVLPTMLYTFFFGIAMYLTLRVTGHIVWPMILHALTDPAVMLYSGGIDETTVAVEGSGPVALLAAASNILTIVGGLIFMWFIRGQIEHTRRAVAAAESAPPPQA